MKKTIIKSKKITARTEAGIIRQAVIFWSQETGTGGSFVIGLENGDPECQELLDYLITNKVANVILSYEDSELVGVGYTGSEVDLVEKSYQIH